MPRIVSRTEIKLPPALQRTCAGVLSPKLDAYLHQLASNPRTWTLAKRNPKAFLAAHGYNMDQYVEFRLMELPPALNIIPPFPKRLCPKGYRLVLRKVRDCVCYRWVEGLVKIKVLPGIPKPIQAKLVPPILIRFKACLKCGYSVHWEWHCERVFHIFPVLPVVRPKPKRPSPR